MKKLILLALLLSPLKLGAQNFPLYNNSSWPDLTVDPSMVKDADVVDRMFLPEACELEEGTIQVAGVHRLLRFTVSIMNRAQLGTGLTIGHPDGPYAQWFTWDVCHQHYHLRDFALYELLDSKGRVLRTGAKRSFCVEDVIKYNDRVSNPSRGYDCGGQWYTPGMGITAGWSDVYSRDVSGQWIDVTGLPGGTYTVRITINAGAMLYEGENRYSDVLEFKANIPAPNRAVPFLVNCLTTDLVCGY